MPRFNSIDGMRAVLAWIVVGDHIAQFTGLPSDLIGKLAHYAVFGFVVISGFVITHLMMRREERYGQYLTRRAFRLFPAYLVCLTISAVSIPLAWQALSVTPWADHAHVERLGQLVSAVRLHPIDQTALHLTLFQGVVPDSVWLRTSTSMLGPAWSLSLEWQFYLIAPLVVAALASRKLAPWAIAAALSLAVGAKLHMFGMFILPSFLPALLILFCVGILLRLHVERLPKLNMSAFEQPQLRFWGERSYATYVVHTPIIQIVVWLLAPRLIDHTIAVAVIAAISILMTLIASDLIYRFIERPMIQVGARLAASRTVAA